MANKKRSKAKKAGKKRATPKYKRKTRAPRAVEPFADHSGTPITTGGDEPSAAGTPITSDGDETNAFGGGLPGDPSEPGEPGW